jgi:ribosomal protein S2
LATNPSAGTPHGWRRAPACATRSTSWTWRKTAADAAAQRSWTARDTVAQRNGRVLFVGTKRQAQRGDRRECGKALRRSISSIQRWLGGLLTNWKTISASIQTPAQGGGTSCTGRAQGLTKKERLLLPEPRARQARQASLGGIQGHGRPAGPDLHHRHQ